MEFIAADLNLNPSRQSPPPSVAEMQRVMEFDEEPQYFEVSHPDGVFTVTRQLANRTETSPPLIERGHFVIGFSGHLTNSKDLARRLDLPKPGLASLPDIALNAWLKWGRDAPQYLYGVFSLLIWDRCRNEVFLAVDHLAQRPLYYHNSASRVLIASLPHAITRAAGVVTDINYSQLARYILPCFTRSNETFLRNIYPVEPGTAILIRNGEIRKNRYWFPEAITAGPDSSCDLRRFRSLVHEAVASAASERTVGTVGVFLSGGLDSSAVATIATEVCRDTGSTLLDPVSTTSWPELESDERDDRYYTSILNAHLGLSLFPVSGLDSTPDAVQRFFASTGMPPTTMDYPVQAQMLQTLRDADASVVLCGEGGEVAASSYARGLLPELLTGGRLLRLSRELCAEFQQGTSVGSLAWDSLYPLIPDSLLRLVGIRKCNKSLTELATNHFLTPDFLSELWKSDLPDEIETAIAYPNQWFPKPLRTVRGNDVESLRLIPESRSMSALGFGLELRCPLLDRSLIEGVFAMPASCRRRNGQSRRLIRDAFRGGIPDAILDRTSKSPLFPDYSRWLVKNQEAISHALSSHCASFDQTILTVPVSTDALTAPQRHRLHVASVSARFLDWARLQINTRNAPTTLIASRRVTG